MTIPRLNGWWDEIAPSFQKFSEKLPDIVHPNRKYLQGVREALAMNPQLMQQYADMETLIPGILEKLGLGGLVAPARTMGASSQLIGERKKREVLSKKLTPEKEAEIEANILGIKTERENKAIDVDTSYKQALTDYQKLTTDIANETRAGRLAEAKMKEAELSAYNNALPIVNRLAQNKLSPFRAHINKQLSPEESAAVMAVPSFKAAWEAEFNIWRGQQEDAYRRERNAIDRASININSTEEQLSKERAKIASAVSAFTGESIDNVFAYQDLDQQRKVILENVQDPSKLNPQEQALWRGMKAVKDYSARMGRKEIQLGLNSSRSFLSSLVKTITGNGDREQKKAAISMYNSEMERIFGPYVEAGTVKGIPTIMYEPSKWRGNVKDLTMLNATSESMEAAHSLGLMITPKAQELQGKLEESNEQFDYTGAAEQILSRAGNDSSKIERELELAAGAGLDKVKLRAELSRRRGNKK